jgi:vacuolar protein sorting-associated protein 13A/C
LYQRIPLVLAVPPEDDPSAKPEEVSSTPSQYKSEISVNLEPELRTIRAVHGERSWPTIDLVVAMNAMNLHTYNASAAMESDLKDHGIAKISLNNTSLRVKMLFDGAMEAQLVLKSFTMSNTKPGISKFREIIPAAQHDRNQFMILYTMSGGSTGSALAILTLDSPQIIFALDPVLSILEFLTFSNSPPNSRVPTNVRDAGARSSTVEFRFDLHDVSISVVENDADPDSQSIKLCVNHILLSHQVYSSTDS